MLTKWPLPQWQTSRSLTALEFLESVILYNSVCLSQIQGILIAKWFSDPLFTLIISPLQPLFSYKSTSFHLLSKSNKNFKILRIKYCPFFHTLISEIGFQGPIWEQYVYCYNNMKYVSNIFFPIYDMNFLSDPIKFYLFYPFIRHQNSILKIEFFRLKSYQIFSFIF